MSSRRVPTKLIEEALTTNAFPALRLAIVVRSLVTLGNYGTKLVSNPSLFAEAKHEIRELLLNTAEGSKGFDLTISESQARSALVKLKKAKSESQIRDLGQTISSIMQITMHELRHSMWHYIPKNYKDYYKQKNIFGEEVAASYPSASHDIEQAGTCLSLGMSTACVFHCMRIMEIGLRACQAILDAGTSPNWGASIKAMTTALEANKSTIDKATYLFYSEAIAHLSTVKNAWRNPSMHFDKKAYSPTEAEGILNAVKGFIVHLSSRLKEL